MPNKKALFTIALMAVLILPLSLVLVPADNVSAVGPPPCTADNIYVNGTMGNDSWNGTSPTGGAPNGPKKTIQQGINAVCDDGTVHVAAGTYNENLTITRALNLEGAGAPVTIIDGSGLTTTVTISSNPDEENMISGFTIQNGYCISSLWKPADQKIMTAGFNLRSIINMFRTFPPTTYMDGGGIYIGETHIVTINDCVIRNNFTERGAGIFNKGQLYINRTTISGNTAQFYGGGIYNTPSSVGESGKAWLTNCTISDNSVTDANGEGAGIYTNYHMELLNVTLAHNTATGTNSKGGGIASMPGNLTAFFKNCIVANNTAGTAGTNNAYYDSADDMVSWGNNLDSENSCNFNQPTDQVNTNPFLGPLQDNGGPTFTHAIARTSPAYNTGTNTGAPATDQRGVTRPQDSTCDIGAYELASSATATATGSGTATFATTTGSITNLTAMAPQDCGAGAPPMYFPHGIFNFTIPNITPGSTVTVVIMLPSPLPTNTEYWKCQNGQWVNCTSLLGSNDGDSVITLTITDGGLGDADGIANGTITDPGGPGFSTASIQGGAEGASSGESTATVIGSPNLRVAMLHVAGQTKVNQPITITANVVNDGDMEGSTRVALKINGQVEQHKLIAVGPGGSRPIKFTVTKAEPGSYSVIVGKQRASFMVKEDSASTTSADGGTIAVIILAILFTAVLIVLLFSFRKRPSY